MNKNLQKICRVCMAEGSRNIFQKPNITTAVPLASVSSPDRLLEKLRYVSLIKIDENDDLPHLLCDLCIIQLNVAYNFKRQAVDTDTKLHQFAIESGYTISQDSTSTLLPNNNKKNLSNSVPKSQQSLGNPFQHRPFLSIPVHIKTEPVDYEIMSDITIETNTETEEVNRNYCGPSTPLSTYINDSVPTPSPQSMVQVNDNNLLAPTSDTEFIKNYIRPLSASSCPVQAQAPLIIATVKSAVNRQSTEQTPSHVTISSADDKNLSESNTSPAVKVNNIESEKAKMLKPQSEANKRRSKKISNRELNEINRIDMNFPKKDFQSLNGSYLLRTKTGMKIDKQKSVLNLKQRVLNPANRMRRKVKEEINHEINHQHNNNMEMLTPNNKIIVNMSRIKEEILELDDQRLTIDLMNTQPQTLKKNLMKKNERKRGAKVNKQKLSRSNFDLFSMPKKILRIRKKEQNYGEKL